MILIILCWCSFVYASDHDYIPNDWVDPTDMRYYDRYTKTMTAPADAVDGIANKKHDKEEIKKFEIFIQRFINRFLQSADVKVRSIIIYKACNLE